MLYCLRNREVIRQTCQRPNIKHISSTEKERDGIRYHHRLGKGFIYDNLTTSRLLLAYGKNFGRAIPFLFRIVLDAKILIIGCHANHQPECRPFGKVILRHFSCSFRTSSDKCFGTGSRGVPKPIQPMSLLNPGLWRLLAGFFPKAGIRLPLLRNFRNMRKRL